MRVLMDSYQELRGDVAKVKKENGFTYKDIGKQIGYSENMVNRFMSSHSMSDRFIIAITNFRNKYLDK